MTAGKMQKPHPSRYGRWIKIQLNPNTAYRETAVSRAGSVPAEREPVRRSAPASAAADPDLKRLDEILGAEYSSDDQPQQEPPATFEEDESLEALESVILGIKQKTIKHSDRKPASAEQSPDRTDQSEDTLEEAVSLLKKDARINLSEIEKQVFSSASEETKSPHLQSFEETEDQYLRELEDRYEQEKK